MSERDPLEGIVELSLSRDDARVVLDLMAQAWDEGRSAGADMGLGIGERVIGTRDDWPPVPVNPYRSGATSAPLAGEQGAAAQGGRRDGDEAQEGRA